MLWIHHYSWSYYQYVLQVLINVLSFIPLQNQLSNVHHPKAVPLGLLGERVVAISAAGVRCSVATESGRVATWLDETLADVATKLEQPAQSFPEVNSIEIMLLSYLWIISYLRYCCYYLPSHNITFSYLPSTVAEWAHIVPPYMSAVYLCLVWVWLSLLVGCVALQSAKETLGKGSQ